MKLYKGQETLVVSTFAYGLTSGCNEGVKSLVNIVLYLFDKNRNKQTKKTRENPQSSVPFG